MPSDLKNIYFENICETSLKAENLDQGATDLENKEGLCNLMSKIYKNRNAKKASFKSLHEFFSYYLHASLFVIRDSTSLIVKQNDSLFVI